VPARGLPPAPAVGIVLVVASAFPRGGPFLSVARRQVAVYTTAIPAAVYEALGAIARRYAPQLNNLRQNNKSHWLEQNP